jgi:hypothetical protein
MFSQYFSKGQGFTHLLLSGGKLKVPDNRHGAFLNTYASNVAKNEPLYVVESKTPVFRLFVDFDYHPVPEQPIITAAVQLMAAVAGYYFESDSDAVVLRKDVETPGKVGVHMTWDTVYVTPVIAKAFRMHVVTKLQENCSSVDWMQVVDGAVYGGSGLRMPWSRKKNAAGVYIPIQVVDNKGTITDVNTPKTVMEIHHWVHRCSIRTPDAQPTGTCIVTAGPSETTTSLSGTTEGPQADTLAEYTDALQMIQQVLPPAFRDQMFTSMHRYADHCIVLRSSSRRCGNKGYTPHATSTVYFVLLRQKGIGYQRCFSRKDLLREGHVTCTDYVGPPFTIPERALDLFWPPAAATTEVTKNKTMELLMRTRPQVRIKKKSKKTTR